MLDSVGQMIPQSWRCPHQPQLPQVLKDSQILRFYDLRICQVHYVGSRAKREYSHSCIHAYSQNFGCSIFPATFIRIIIHLGTIHMKHFSTWCSSIKGGIHGWGTTFGCLTEKGLFQITSHAWYAQICIVKHILDHTYISYSILSTPTKLIQKEQGHLRYHFDSLKDIQECCLNC